jgi:WD40 repeat protein/basic membrane lipoprotein Med (substrate-binding protein (PBP1-ABC) superfamily)/DNA-binding SARP family transcriptional activator
MLQICCLGQFQVKTDGKLVEIPSRPVQSLFAYLALNAGLAHRREKLAGLIWPDSNDENARSYLRQGLWRIHKALDAAGTAWQDYFQIDDIHISIGLQSGAFIDAHFLAHPNSGDGWTIADLEKHVQVYKGELLPGFYDEWVILERERLRSAYDQKMKLLLEQLEVGQYWEELVEWSERWIATGHVPEPAYRALMIAHAQQENVTALNIAYQRCQKSLAEELGVPPSVELHEIYQKLLRGEKQTPAPKQLPDLHELTSTPPAPGTSPYKGLEYFDVNDAALFFGRERLTTHLLSHLQTSSFLAVVGASGSGKSSIVRAGLIPALESQGWLVGIMTPTAHPRHALHALFTKDQCLPTETFFTEHVQDQIMLAHLDGQGARRSLLVIDQFEEIFTLCDDEQERQAYLNHLFTVRDNEQWSVMIVLRSDFYANCGQYQALRDALSNHQEYIGPMSAEELRSAMEEPARREGWQIEPGLVDLILREVKGEPGALPLLSHTLLETWKRRSGRWMTLKGYAEVGGVHGAVTRTAEMVFNRQLNEEQQNIARKVFLRLTELQEDLTGTRRRVNTSEFLAGPAGDEQVKAVLNILAAARLITMSENNVEIAHEALIREWPKLRQWLEEDRAGIRLHHQLAEAARHWEEFGRDASELYRGARLAQVLEWADKNAGLPNPLEQDFLQAAVYDEQRLQVEKEQQQQRELEAAQQLAASESQRAEQQTWANRRLRIFAIGLSLIFLATLVTAWVALDQRNRANRTTHLAHSRELSAAAINNLERDPQLSILLALEAIHESKVAQVPIAAEMESALHQAVRVSKQKLVLKGHTAGVYGSSFSRDGKTVVTASGDGTLISWNAQTGEMNHTFVGHQSRVLGASFHSNGRWLASTSRDHTTRLWDLKTGKEIWSYRDEFSFAFMLTYSPIGDHIAIAQWDGRMILLDVSSGKPIREIYGRPNVISIAYHPAGTSIAVVDGEGVVDLFDPRTGEKLETIDFDFDYQSVLAFSPNGKRLAVAGDGIKLWDMDEGALLWSNTSEPGSGYTDVKFSPDGRFLVAAGYSKGAQVWEADSGNGIMTLSGHAAETFSASFHPAGNQILTGSQDGTARIWDFSSDREVAFIPSPQGKQAPKSTRRAEYSPDGHWLAAGEGDDGAIGLWDAVSGERIRIVRSQEATAAVSSVAFHPGGKTLVSAHIDGKIALWDIASGQALKQWQAYEEEAAAIRFNHAGNLIVTSGFNNLVKFWDAVTGEPAGNPLYSYQSMSYLAISPDDRAVLLLSHIGAQRYVDIQTGQDLRLYRGQMGGVLAAAFSHDGNIIASANEYGSGNVVLWETESVQKLHTLDHATTNAVGLAFSPDDRQLATIGLDASLRVWDVNTGQQTLLLEDTSTLLPTGVAFSPDGKSIAVTCKEGIHIYLVHLEDLIQLALTRLSRSFTQEECLRYAVSTGCAQKEVAIPAQTAAPSKDRRLACYLPDWGGINRTYFAKRPYEAMLEAARQFSWETVAHEPLLVFEMSESIQKLNGSGCDLIILSTFEDASIALPAEHPDQRYIFVEADNPKENWDNVWNTFYRVDQAAFLGGYLAAAMSRTGTVGIFGGAPIPAVLSFMDGFALGVDAYNQRSAASVELIGWHTGGKAGQGIFTNFDSPDFVSLISQELIAQGADILFPVAGYVNMIAASEAALSHEGVWVIGVDQDWAVDYPEYAPVTLTSVMKNIGSPVFLAMEAITNGTFSGGAHYATLENGGVGLAPFHDFEDQIPDEIKAELEQLRQDIIEGKVKTK